MPVTIEELLKLIQESSALQEHPAEQAFWTANIARLTTDQKMALFSALTAEATDVKKIHSDHSQKLIEINQKQIAFLEEFRHKTLPAFVKKAESKLRAEENPDALLDQLKNE